MANLAIVGSHSTNGVAAIHSELLRTDDRQGPGRDVSRALQQQDQRRHAAALAAARAIRRSPTRSPSAIGDGWITDLSAAAQAQAAGRRQRPSASRSARPSARPRRNSPTGSSARRGPGRSIPTRSSTARSSASTSTSGSCSTRCASSCSTTGCARIPNLDDAAAHFFFAGKAAPAYHLAKLIIKFINNLAATIDGDPAVRGRLKVVFLPDYCVDARRAADPRDRRVRTRSRRPATRPAAPAT